MVVFYKQYPHGRSCYRSGDHSGTEIL